MRRNLRLLLILMVIVNIIVLIFLIIYKNNLNYERNSNEAITSQYATEEIYTGSIELDKKIYPERRYEFEKLYTNTDNCKVLYRYIYDLVKNMPNLYEKIKNLDDGQLNNFYKDNRGILNKVYRINTEDEFEFIVKQCRQIYKDGYTTYKTVRFLLDSFEQQDNSLKCDLEIEYNNSVVIKYSINIYNINNKNIEVYFKPIVNEELPKIYGS